MAKELKTFMTPPFRGNFTDTLFVPDSMDGGPLKYGVMAIWDPRKFTEKHKALWAAIQAEMDSVSMAAFKKKVADLPANFKRGIRDGEEKLAMGDVFANGAKFANLTTKLIPGVVDIENDPETGKPMVISEKNGNRALVYSGCLMRAKVTIYHYDNKGKGIALGLMNAQRLGGGPRLDYRGDAAADFADDEEDQDFINQMAEGDGDDPGF